MKLASLLLAALLLPPQAIEPLPRAGLRADGGVQGQDPGGRPPFLEPGNERLENRGWLESLDRFLARTLPGWPGPACGFVAQSVAGARAPVEVLLFGGGTGHDFALWFGAEDARTLQGLTRVRRYTESPAEVLEAFPTLGVLVFSTNQPLPDPEFRRRLVAFVERGGGLVVLHAGTWFNREDWVEWTQLLLAGGTYSHEAYGGFEVRLEPVSHPLLAGLPSAFTIQDELYRLELTPDPGTTILASGHSSSSGASYPLLWTRTHGRGRIVGLTLGHDGAAHRSSAYRQLLVNAVRWVMR